MAKGKKKKGEGEEEGEEPTHQRPRPRNTVTWRLDGEPEDVQASYEAAQDYFRYWFFCNAQYRVKTGNRMIYTCPLDGTFYYLVRYHDRFVAFILEVRQYWLLGIWNSHGFFQSVWKDNREFYMDSNNTVSTGFALNHKDVADGGVERTQMGIWPLRNGHDALSAYKGPNHPEPKGFREAWDTYIVFIMETKFLQIMRKCCSLMNDFGRLGLSARNLIVQWKSLCRTVMQGIEEGFDKQEDLDRACELMGTILIYHVDAWTTGKIFSHPPLPPKPREAVWAPIDEGDGDGDIQNPDAVTPLPQAPSRPQRVTSTKAGGGRKRGSIQVEDKHGKRPRRECTGLRGGGVGGVAEVPPWFLEWSQDVADKEVLNRLVTFAKKELGLSFVDAPVLHLKQTVEKEMQSLQLKNARTQPSGSVVEDIREGGFITDGIISQYFERLAPTLPDQVNLLSPANSLAFAHDPDAMDAAVLASSQINIIPVNDSTSDEADMGSHWSVMVMYRPINGAPRLVHHDSTEGRINNAAAERLASSIRNLLPPFQGSVVEHANTPLQDNDTDCAVFVMAITNSIARWWLSSDHQGQEPRQDWVNTLMGDVNQNVVTRMRNLLPEFLEGQMTTEELNSRCFFSGDGIDEQKKDGLP